MYKKNGLDLVAGASSVLLIVIIGVVAVVGININTQLESISLDQTRVNETVTITNNTYNALNGDGAVAIYTIGNTTWNINTTVGSGNWTVFSNITGSSFNFVYSSEGSVGTFVDGSYWVSYDYMQENNAYRAATNTTRGVQQVTQQLTLVGLIVVLSIVIGLLWSSFGGVVTAGKI